MDNPWNGKNPSFLYSNPTIITKNPDELPDTVDIKKPWDIRPSTVRPSCPKVPEMKQMFHKADYEKMKRLIEPGGYYMRNNPRLAKDIYAYGGLLN